jgi:hypothetical protein
VPREGILLDIAAESLDTIDVGASPARPGQAVADLVSIHRILLPLSCPRARVFSRERLLTPHVADATVAFVILV